MALGEQGGGPGARLGVRALPHRAEAEDGDLPGVPVVQAVEAEDLIEGRIAGGVPALVLITGGIGGRREESGEQALLGGELQEVRIPERGRCSC